MTASLTGPKVLTYLRHIGVRIPVSHAIFPDIYPMDYFQFLTIRHCFRWLLKTSLIWKKKCNIPIVKMPNFEYETQPGSPLLSIE